MKVIDVTAAPTLKIVTCEGAIIGTLPLDSAVYGMGNGVPGLLYAHDRIANTWHMITPKAIHDYPAARTHVARGIAGKPYVLVG